MRIRQVEPSFWMTEFTCCAVCRASQHRWSRLGASSVTDRRVSLAVSDGHRRLIVVVAGTGTLLINAAAGDSPLEHVRDLRSCPTEASAGSTGTRLDSLGGAA
jgi:hypothetical protein